MGAAILPESGAECRAPRASFWRLAADIKEQRRTVCDLRHAPVDDRQYSKIRPFSGADFASGILSRVVAGEAGAPPLLGCACGGEQSPAIRERINGR